MQRAHCNCATPSASPHWPLPSWQPAHMLASPRPPAASASHKAGRRQPRSVGGETRCRAYHPDVPHLPEEPQEFITFLTSDGGMVRFPARPGPIRRVKQRPTTAPMPTWDEQKLCIGASFSVAAINGNPTRRVAFQGFCQSVDLLFEAVEDVVILRGGEILDEQRQLKSGLHEELKLLVAIPFLWGVPPTLDCLKSAIVGGGGIVERIQHRWDMWSC